MMLVSRLCQRTQCRGISRKVSLRPIKIHYPSSNNNPSENTEVMVKGVKPELNVEKHSASRKNDNKNPTQKDFKLESVDNILKMTRKNLDKNNVIILEGKRLINDALLNGLQICTLFYANFQHVQDPPISLLPSEQKVLISQTELKKWSYLSTCPGIMGVFEKPDLPLINEDVDYPVSVICDNIRDPGNVGSLLRCASAAGCKNIFFTEGCVNIWDRKVLRAAAGCHFKLNLHHKLTWLEIEQAMNEINQIYVADIFESDNGKENPLNLSAMCMYTNVKFTKQKTALIIGGETHGLSPSARNLVTNKKGCGLVIPMKNNVQSLNSATALGILLFEIRRQFDISE